MLALSSDRRSRAAELTVFATLSVAIALCAVPARAQPAEPRLQLKPPGEADAGTPPAAAPAPALAPAAAPEAEPGAAGSPAPAATEATPSEPQPEAEPAAAGPGAPATPCEGKKIVRLDVKGQGRVSRDDIMATIRLRADTTCHDLDVTRDVKALWDMGYFADVEVSAEPKTGGVVLTFRVKERPAISEVIYDGNDEIDTSDIKEKVTLEEGSVLSEPAVREQLEKIHEAVRREGLLPRHGHVQARAAPEELGRGALRDRRRRRSHGAAPALHRQREPGRVRSARRDADERDRLPVLPELEQSLQEGSHRRGHQPAAGVLLRLRLLDRRDRRAARRAHARPPPHRHHDRDQARARASRSAASRPPRSTTGHGDRAAAPAASSCARRSSSTPATGSAARASPRTCRRSRATTATRGYAHAEVSPQTDLHQDTRIVDVVVTIRRGPLVYIQRINVKGNNKTRDAVLRREMRIVEGQLYSQSLARALEGAHDVARLLRAVELSEEDGATPDRIVLNFEVTERPTGTFQLGAGFSSQETFIAHRPDPAGEPVRPRPVARLATCSSRASASSRRSASSSRICSAAIGRPPSSCSRSCSSRSASTATRPAATSRWATRSLHQRRPAPVRELPARVRRRSRPRPAARSAPPVTAFSSSSVCRSRNLFNAAGAPAACASSLTYDTRDNRLFPSKGVYVSASTEVSDAVHRCRRPTSSEHEANFRGYKPLLGDRSSAS